MSQYYLPTPRTRLYIDIYSNKTPNSTRKELRKMKFTCLRFRNCENYQKKKIILKDRSKQNWKRNKNEKIRVKQEKKNIT